MRHYEPLTRCSSANDLRAENGPVHRHELSVFGVSRVTGLEGPPDRLPASSSGDFLAANCDLWGNRRNMSNSLRLTFTTLLLAVSSLSAATHYVSLGSTNPKPPYTTWVTAAMNIQDALNVAAANDVVLVTNGVYPGHVSVTNALALRSVNGPQFTIINGGGMNRCVDLTGGASLTGFTLTNGYTEDWGGGVECASPNAFLTNCLIVGNSAVVGGGASGGTLHNCTLSGNSAGGGEGGGAYSCALYNCIVYHNTASGGANYDSSSTFNYFDNVRFTG
jgi:hypothetical protein